MSERRERRSAFFGQQVLRLMTMTAVANDLGHCAFSLLAIIAAQQDAARGRAVTFWNDQLMAIAGIKDERTLRRVRQACIDSGWLRYEHRGPRKAGLYEVIIPDRFAHFPDSRCDEGGSCAVNAGDSNHGLAIIAPNHAPDGIETPALDARPTRALFALDDAPNDVPDHAPNDARPPSSPLPSPSPLNNSPLTPQGGTWGAGDVTVPTAMDTPEVRHSLGDWIAHLRRLGREPKSAKAMSTLMRRALDRGGPLVFVQAVGKAMGNGSSILAMPYPAAFETWFSAYPRLVAKEEAFEAYGKAVHRISEQRGLELDQARQWLLAVTNQFATTPKGLAGDKCPYPATWLNSGRYDDNPAEWQRVEGTSNGKPTGYRIGPGQRYQG